jgi:hypothetical protein
MNRTINAAKNLTRVIAVRPEYVKFTGASAAMLLSQIVYWFSNNRLRVKRDGRLWLAKTREELAAECGLSLDQYKRAIKKLKELELVQVEAHMWNGFRTSFIWLDQQRLAQITPTGRVVSAPTGRGRLHRPITETTAETTDREQQTRLASQEQKRVGEAQEQVREKKPRAIADWVAERPVLAEQRAGRYTAQEWLMKASEILKRHQEQAGLRAPPRAGVNSLAIAWKKAVAGDGGDFVKDLTQKELGQLKQLMAKVGSDTPQLIAWALPHWPDFAFSVRHQKDLKSSPSEPHLGFLLAHHDVAMNLYLQSIAEPKSEPKPRPKIVSAPTVEKPEVEEPTATIEDVMAALAECERRHTPNEWRDIQRQIPGAYRRFR